MLFRFKTNGAGEVKKPDQGGSRAQLMITIVLLAVVGGAYYAYYRKQAEYYTGRNLRLLAMLTAQVDGRVDMFINFARAHVNEKPGDGNDKASYSPPKIRFGDCTATTLPEGAVRREIGRPNTSAAA